MITSALQNDLEFQAGQAVAECVLADSLGGLGAVHFCFFLYFFRLEGSAPISITRNRNTRSFEKQGGKQN
jgi:hypothetical protein